MQLALVLDDDPGRDLGLLRQPGHRFFYATEKWSTDVPRRGEMKRTILVAGIGNIFFGDDAFGCEVASQLARRPLPEGVRVIDFGIRSYDLAYAHDGWL